MAKKKSKAREKQRQQQKARKAAKKKRLQQSGRTSGYSTLATSSMDVSPPSDLGFGPDEFGILVIDSEHLADEPEFEDIFLDPLACLGAWNDAAEAMRLDKKRQESLSEDEQENIRLDLLEAIVKSVLTAELRQEIIKQADALQQRYKKKGKGLDINFLQASAVYTFLDMYNKKGESWTVVGLVRALVEQSLELGFGLADILGESPNQVFDDPEKEKQLQALYDKAPKLRQYIEEKMSGLWQEGMAEVFTGEWQIGLFTLDELEGSVEIFRKHFPEEGPDEEEPNDARRRTEQLVEEMEEYTRRLLTPERAKAMGQHLDNLKANAPQGPRLLFVKLLGDDIRETDEPGDLAPTLMKVLMGETLAVLRETAEDESE